MSQVKFRVLPIAFGIACMSAGVSFAADAPKAAAAATAGIEEVIITARKTEESVQAVPVSVTALSSAALEKQAVLSVADLRTAVPGLFVAANSQGGAPTFAIRAAKADNGTSDTVTAYIGDMPVTTTRAVGNMVYDMQSISVLKGPQGTLFGANSTGGAIIFRPNTPTDTFEGYAQLGIGNYERQSFQGAVNLPISDTVQLRLAGEWVDQSKGFQKNLTPTNGNTEMGTDKHESARAILRIKPNASLTNDLMFNYFHQNDQMRQEHQEALRGPFIASGVNVDYAAAGIRTFNDIKTVAIGTTPTWNKAKITDIVDTLNYDISANASFKAVLGYEKAELDTYQDNDAGRLNGVNGRTTHNFEQWTFEPSLDLKTDDGRLRNKTGLYVSQLKKQTGNSYTVLGLPYTAPAAFFPVQSNSFYWRDFKSHAVYTQFSYDLTKELTATLGLRYTWDRANYKASNRLGFAYNSATNQTNPAFGAVAIGGNMFTGPCAAGLRNYKNFNAAACTGEQDLKSQAPSFTFTLEDKFAERSMVYATLRGGYLVGGFNNQVYTPDRGGQLFEPEKVVDFETGLKSDWDLWNRPIRTNVAVFYSNYKNMQRVQNGQSADPISGAVTTYIAVQNAGAATAYGFDLDVTYEPTDNLTLTAGWNHIESEYTKYLAPVNIPNVTAFVDLAGQQLSQTPQDIVSLSASYKWPLASDVGTVSSTLSYFWTDKTEHHDSPTYNCAPNAAGLCSAGPTSAAVDFRAYDGLPAYDLFNFTTSWKGIMGSNFDADFWIKNLTDKKYKTYGSNQMLQYGYATYWYGDPRTYGLNVRYNF